MQDMIYRNALARSRMLTIAFIGVLAACASLRVGSDFDRNAVFSSYHTFAWMPREHQGTRNPLVVERASAVIAAAGPVTAGRVSFTNRQWEISEEALRDFGFGEAS